MLLLDQNISFRLSKLIQEDFPNTIHISDIGLYGGRDEKIWQYAKTNNLSILTFDSDFYDLALVRGIPPKIIWMRTGNLTTSEIRNLLVQNKIAIYDFLNEIDSKDAICLQLISKLF